MTVEWTGPNPNTEFTDATDYSLGGEIVFHDVRVTSTSGTTRLVGVPFCPDILRYDNLGEADNLRGRVVRAFFWLMRIWPT